MKKLIVMAEGGLGNKLNCLFQGIDMCNKTERSLAIANIKNNFGNFCFTELLNFSIEYKNFSSIREFDDEYTSNIPIYLHKKNYNYNRPVQKCNELFKCESENAIFLTDKCNVDISTIIGYLKNFSLNKSILERTKTFIEQHEINEDVIGIHIRGTDFSSRVENIKYAVDIITHNKNKKIFVCTDEQHIEKILSTKSNVFFYSKNHFVKKLDEKLNWMGTIKDVDSRSWNFNVDRSENSVKEAFIEMLVLSETTMYGNLDSSFFRWANIIKQTNFLKKQLCTAN